ncbi:TolC family protein [Solidesulfovibrio sp.]|uniref:TolC family protein n=1 Tax=Solidesulfovibrio sp. TaxID=2910990 RepID=UPI00260F845E|nr:TolC family protein [Solidesulfovibrio sp.]
MIPFAKRRSHLVLFAGVLAASLIVAQGLARAQDATAPAANDRVAQRYTRQPKADAASQAAPASDGLDVKIQKIPLPDFVKEQQTDPALTQHTQSGAGSPAAEGDPIDMEKSVKRGLDANPQMQSARALLAGSEDSRRQAMSNFGFVGTVSYAFQRTDSQVVGATTQTLPANQVLNNLMGTSLSTSRYVNARSGYWQNIYQFQLQATQPLFTGFKLLSTYQKAALQKDYSTANISYTELSLIKSVQQAFLTLLQARANVQSNKDSVARLESQYKVAQAYYDVGLKPRLDVLQAESDLAQAEQDLLKAQNAVLVQTAQLNSLLNLPLNQQTNYVGELTYLPFTMTIEDCLDTAYKQRPDLYMGVKSVQMAEKDVKIAASTFYPQVQAQATYTKQGNDPGLELRDMSGATTPESSTFAITASLQAWDWGSTFFGTQAARESVKKLQADLANLRLNVGYQVKTCYLNIQDAAKRISVARTALEASREGYRMAVARYQAQVGTSTDVLDAQARVSTAEYNLTQALTDYQSALADIYVAMGIKNLSLASN